MQQNKLDLFLSPLMECRDYKPKLGHTRDKGYDLEQFLKLYDADPFYSWIGLNSPSMYAAHKAAGAMTSIYRQLGTGCERLFRQIIFEAAQYADIKEATWSYETQTKSGKTKTLSLDAFLDFSKIRNEDLQNRLNEWTVRQLKEQGLRKTDIKGIVFEVRQGYKSKDSKRQNADLDNVAVAYANDLLPVFAVFSSQIDSDIVLRYKNSKCSVLTGGFSNDISSSLFAFTKEILGFDLAGFFRHHSSEIRSEIDHILTSILSPA